jgi:hypothetical protein
LGEEIAAIAVNRPLAASLYLDTKEEHSRPWPFEGKDHHQGLTRTHRLQDGSVYFFLTHSEVGPGEQGQLMQFRYDGPLQGEHIAASDLATMPQPCLYRYAMKLRDGIRESPRFAGLYRIRPGQSCAGCHGTRAATDLRKNGTRVTYYIGRG